MEKTFSTHFYECLFTNQLDDSQIYQHFMLCSELEKEAYQCLMQYLIYEQLKKLYVSYINGSETC